MGIGRFAGHIPRPCQTPPDRRRAARQELRIGMAGPGKDRLRRSLFDDRAEIENGYAVADRLDHRKVVADENVSQVVAAAQIGKQVQDLCLDGNVERGYRLIEDNDARVRCKGTGNADALCLTAGKFVRVAFEKFRPQVDRVQQFVDALLARGLVHPVQMG